ncbi:hypothetical protein KC331_g19941 [Hortaea werneckii]|uniref:Uncharacterized protein n=1 Tax=Hortaea werneckii TaxID=91943 RepID=A0A3M7D0G8_HORWE|nr:hypothetical protein KC331_g19941 [Hortaea werneckii]KAI7715949.1 hypothetical protein KC353_g5721 [Hortaea werneckii]RMY57769.1 hypothetical protein D0865_02954 [Hortaea werneckii]
MNTIRSVGYGWAVLIVAGGGSYYFAKRSINADREARAEDAERRRQQRERMRVQAAFENKSSATPSGPSTLKRQAAATGGDDNPSPSRQATEGDPAPVTHAQEEAATKGKYEAAEPFRSRKGDRFSSI